MRRFMKSWFTITLLASWFVASFSIAARAEERKPASATLHIQVVVVPTLVAAQHAAEAHMVQTAGQAISYVLPSDRKNCSTYSIREISVNQNGAERRSVLKTLTVVSE